MGRLTFDFDGFVFCCTLFNIVWIKGSQIIANHLMPPLISTNFFSQFSQNHFGINIYGFVQTRSIIMSNYSWSSQEKPACDRRASLSKGGVYHRSLALSLISNFDPCSLSSLYPPCVKGPVRTFSLMRTVLRGDTKSYKINTSKPLLSKLSF